jgi:hypothetical protein
VKRRKGRNVRLKLRSAGSQEKHDGKRKKKERRSASRHEMKDTENAKRRGGREKHATRKRGIEREIVTVSATETGIAIVTMAGTEVANGIEKKSVEEALIVVVHSQTQQAQQPKRTSNKRMKRI